MTVLLSVTGLLLLGAFVITLMAATGRAQLWVAVLLLTLANLISLTLGTRL
jgi:hypothetical protein